MFYGEKRGEAEGGSPVLQPLYSGPGNVTPFDGNAKGQRILTLPLVGILGSSWLEGRLMCKHGAVVHCGWAGKGPSLCPQISTCSVWPR